MGGVRSKCLSPESPLDNDMLLETIFKALPSAELVRGRLVSKRWEECATRVMKKRRDLVISLDCKTIGEFTSSMENSWKPPFPCYRLECVYFGDESFRKFTQVCGDSVATLSFDFDIPTTENRVKTPGCSSCLDPLQKMGLAVENDLIENVILKLESTLEVLKFPTMPFSNPETSIEVKVTFRSNRKIVKLTFPNDQDRLDVHCVCQDLAEFISRVFSLSRNLVIDSSNDEIAALLKSCGILDLVTNLDICNCTQVFVLELLDSNIFLEEFHAWGGPDTRSLDLVQSFLKNQRKRLNVLRLSLDYFNFIWRKGLKLPIMSELKELNMMIYEDDIESYIQFLTSGGLDLLCNLPKLRRLSFQTLGAYQGSELESIFSNNLPIVPFTRLESLYIEVQDEGVAIHALPYFGKRFPNITKLLLDRATTKILRTLFEVADWGLNLKELEIWFREPTGDIFNDCGICGFTSEWRRGVGMKLLMNKDQGAILREAEAWNRGPVGSGGIKKFPNLEKFSFIESGRVYTQETKKFFISDLSIYFALVNLKSLRSLKISGIYLITPEALMYLKAHCPVLRSVVIC